MAQAVKRRMLVMENGSVHEGTGFGSMNDAVCELVFNTSMVGTRVSLSSSVMP